MAKDTAEPSAQNGNPPPVKSVPLAAADTDHVAMTELLKDQRQLLDQIDELRKLGVGSLVPLPQLVVCGAQSAGKSSVLEAISRFRFPIRESTCTRWATELILKRAEGETVGRVSVSSADPARTTNSTLLKLTNRISPLTDMNHLAKVIEEVQEEFEASIGDTDQGLVVEETLRIEVCGADQPNLTLVDLPGLISEGTKERIAAPKRMTDHYLRNERAIILLILEAHRETDNQEILNFVNQHDKERKRTLGILTKPDRIEHGSLLESVAVDLANNRHKRYGGFEYGWAVLKNREPSMRTSTDAERDESEQAFFRQGIWSGVDPQLLGVKSLRSRLSRILLQKIGSELPQLIKDINARVNDASLQLQRLGPERATASQQQGYLLTAATRLRELIISGKKGDLSDPFFASRSQGVDTKLRAVVYRLISEYNEEMMKPATGSGTVLALLNADRKQDALDAISRKAAAFHGKGLPGFPNFDVLEILFHEEVSNSWRAITLRYAERLFDYIRGFLFAALEDASDVRTARRIVQDVVINELLARRDKLRDNCSALLVPHEKGRLITYDLDYEGQCRTLNETWDTSEEGRVLFGAALKASDGTLQEQSARLILSSLSTYYKMKAKIMVDNFAVLAIEHCLLDGLEDVLPIETFIKMDDDTLGTLAAEEETLKGARRSATRNFESLKKAQDSLETMMSTATSLGGPSSRAGTQANSCTPNDPRFTSQPQAPESSSVPAFKFSGLNISSESAETVTFPSFGSVKPSTSEKDGPPGLFGQSQKSPLSSFGSAKTGSPGKKSQSSSFGPSGSFGQLPKSAHNTTFSGSGSTKSGTSGKGAQSQQSIEHPSKPDQRASPDPITGRCSSDAERGDNYYANPAHPSKGRKLFGVRLGPQDLDSDLGGD